MFRTCSHADIAPAMIEPLEDRLCLSASTAVAAAATTTTTTTGLSAHQRHVIHVRQVAAANGDGTVVAVSTTTLSRHQRHLHHVAHSLVALNRNSHQEH